MFRDATGREWSTSINVTTVKRVKERADVLLTDAADSDLVERLYGDVMLLSDVLAAVCLPKIVESGMTATDFGELLAGDVIDHACESLMDDLVLFFPSGRREVVRTIWTAARDLEREKVSMIDRKMSPDQIRKIISLAKDKAEKDIDDVLAQLGEASGN